MPSRIHGRDADVVSTWILNADQYKKELTELSKDIRASQREIKNLETVQKELGGSFDTAAKKTKGMDDAVEKLTKRFLTLELAKKIVREMDEELTKLGKTTIGTSQEASSAAAAYIGMKEALSGVGIALIDVIDKSSTAREVFKFLEVYAQELSTTFHLLAGNIGLAALSEAGISRASFFKGTEPISFKRAETGVSEMQSAMDEERIQRELGIGQFKKRKPVKAKGGKTLDEQIKGVSFGSLGFGAEDRSFSEAQGAQAQEANMAARQRELDMEDKLIRKEMEANAVFERSLKIAKERKEATEANIAAVKAHTEAIGLSAATALVEGKNIGKAIMSSVKSRLKGISIMSIVDAGRETALGIGSLFTNPAAAATHFASAAKHVAVAALAGGGAAIAGAAGGGGGSGQAGNAASMGQQDQSRPFKSSTREEDNRPIVVNLRIDKADPASQLLASRQLKAALAGA